MSVEDKLAQRKDQLKNSPPIDIGSKGDEPKIKELTAQREEAYQEFILKSFPHQESLV